MVVHRRATLLTKFSEERADEELWYVCEAAIAANATPRVLVWAGAAIHKAMIWATEIIASRLTGIVSLDIAAQTAEAHSSSFSLPDVGRQQLKVDTHGEGASWFLITLPSKFVTNSQYLYCTL